MLEDGVGEAAREAAASPRGGEIKYRLPATRARVAREVARTGDGGPVAEPRVANSPIARGKDGGGDTALEESVKLRPQSRGSTAASPVATAGMPGCCCVEPPTDAFGGGGEAPPRFLRHTPSNAYRRPRDTWLRYPSPWFDSGVGGGVGNPGVVALGDDKVADRDIRDEVGPRLCSQAAQRPPSPTRCHPNVTAPGCSCCWPG